VSDGRSRERAQGLTFDEVGHRLGVSRETARHLVLAAAPPCQSCAAPAPRLRRAGRCPACVAADPAAPFADRLWALRLAAGLTQEELGARAGLSHATVSDCERGRRRPRPGLLAALSGVLGPGLLAGPGGPRGRPAAVTPEGLAALPAAGPANPRRPLANNACAPSTPQQRGHRP
jgi:transcriptional regulator with XRE-family HTH domain